MKIQCRREQGALWHVGVGVTLTDGDVSVYVHVDVPDPKVLGDAEITIHHAEAIGLGKDAQKKIKEAARTFLGGRFL